MTHHHLPPSAAPAAAAAVATSDATPASAEKPCGKSKSALPKLLPPPHDPSALASYDMQVAGHGSLRCISSDFVLKPCAGAEPQFYAVTAPMRVPLSAAPSSAERPEPAAGAECDGCCSRDGGDTDGFCTRHAGLLSFLPPYYGASASGLVLGNLLLGYCRPCVLDLKIGTRLFEDSAAAEKKKRMLERAARSTTGCLGVRVCGMRTTCPPSSSPKSNSPVGLFLAALPPADIPPITSVLAAAGKDTRHGKNDLNLVVVAANDDDDIDDDDKDEEKKIAHMATLRDQDDAAAPTSEHNCQKSPHELAAVAVAAAAAAAVATVVAVVAPQKERSPQPGSVAALAAALPPGVTVRGREYGYSLDAASFPRAFLDFTRDMAPVHARNCLESLRKLVVRFRDSFLSSTTDGTYIGTSLLVVADALESVPPRVALHWIDFAHSRWSDSGGKQDDQFLFGIKNTLEAVEMALKLFDSDPTHG